MIKKKKEPNENSRTENYNIKKNLLVGLYSKIQRTEQKSVNFKIVQTMVEMKNRENRD